MSERTLDGLAAARARARTGGQKAELTHAIYRHLAELPTTRHADTGEKSLTTR